jgi:hypothetical protein
MLGYYDANWGDDLEERRSNKGFVFMIGGGAIS